MAAFEMVVKLRPCLVKGKKHLFHCWDHRAWTVGESALRGGPSRGQCSMVLAVVEDEYGQVHEVYSRDVRFLDDQIKEYGFGGENNDCSQDLPGEDTRELLGLLLLWLYSSLPGSEQGPAEEGL